MSIYGIWCTINNKKVEILQLSIKFFLRWLCPVARGVLCAMQHPNSIAWLGAKSSMGSSGIDNEWLDMVFDTAAGKVIHIKSGAKGSVLPEYLYNDYKRSQSSFRITYVFARSIPGMCTSLRKEEETPVVFVCLCLFVLHIYYKQ